MDGPRISWGIRKIRQTKRSNEFLPRPIGFDDDDSDARPSLAQAQILQNLPVALKARYVVNHAGNRSMISLAPIEQVFILMKYNSIIMLYLKGFISKLIIYL